MKKTIIIDFDHTIGYFDQIVYILNIIEKTYHQTLNDLEVFDILDHYPYIFRPRIFDIIELIKKYQFIKKLQFFILYTCNKNIKFVNTITKYIEQKINSYNIFNFKIFNYDHKKKIETIYTKTNNQVQENDVLCFIDNKYFTYRSKHIKYIKCEKYIYNYDTKTLLHIFPFKKYNLLNKKTIMKYLKILYKKKPLNPQLPRNSYEINSNYILSLLYNFIHDH